jgi:hypothetical protein
VAERPTKTTLPDGKVVDASEVPVTESIERWSEFKLEDGTTIRAKMTVLSVARVPGMWDPQGNPFYTVNGAPVMIIAESPPHLRKKE